MQRRPPFFWKKCSRQAILHAQNESMPPVCRPFFALLCLPFLAKSQDTLWQLAPPRAIFSSQIIQKSVEIGFDFRLTGSQVRFTTDGSEPTENSPLLSEKLLLKKPLTIKAKSFADGFLPSQTIDIQLIEAGFQIEKATVNPPPSTKYAGLGPQVLTDGQLGGSDFQAGNWLGFDQPEVEIELVFSKKQRVKNLRFCLLENQSAWIFLPSKAVVWVDEKEVATAFFPFSTDRQPTSGHRFLDLELPKKQRTDRLKIRLSGSRIPEWHDGRGSPAWFFLDEIIVR